MVRCFKIPRNFHDLAELRERAWETQLWEEMMDVVMICGLQLLLVKIDGCFQK